MHLPFTTLFSGEEKWVVVEITLKPRPTAQSGEIFVCGDLSVPGDYEPSYASDAVLTRDELLEYVEEALVVKSLHHKSTFKTTLAEKILRVLHAKKNIAIETERVNRAIESTIRKFNLTSTASRIILTNLILRRKN